MKAYDKGSVENLVGYARRNTLVPHDRPFASFEELNAHLHAWCERERVRSGEAWALEETALRELPAQPFRAATSRPVSVSKLALARIDYNRYSVPVRHAGRLLRAEVYVDKIDVYADERRVATHTRTYERGGTFMKLEHYLPAFERKPRAASGCAALQQADPVFLQVRDLLLPEPGGYRVFAEILLLGLRFPLPVVAEALRTCLASGRLSVEGVRQRCLNLTHALPEPAVVPDVLQVPLAPPDLDRYDALCAVAR